MQSGSKAIVPAAMASPHTGRSPVAGGQYLTVAAKAPGGRAARLVLPLGHLLHSGDLCLSFKHKVTGLHSGTLQVSVRRPGSHGAALWGRDSGRGWRWTHITLRGADIKSVSRKVKNKNQHKLQYASACLSFSFSSLITVIH